MIKLCIHESPCGPLLLGESDGAVCLCDWIEDPAAEELRKRKKILADAACLPESLYPLKRVAGLLGATAVMKKSRTLRKAARELDGYFAGKRREFKTRLLFAGTQFQMLAWTELMKVPYGKTVSYSELSKRMDNPSAARAVANAMASNPISIFVPCHRIIGSDGDLTGYGGGIHVKEYLLQLEGAIVRMPTLF